MYLKLQPVDIMGSQQVQGQIPSYFFLFHKNWKI